MCLTLDMLVAFMALLPMDIIETEVDRIVIQGSRETAVWEARGDLWCIDPKPFDTAKLDSRTLADPNR